MAGLGVGFPEYIYDVEVWKKGSPCKDAAVLVGMGEARGERGTVCTKKSRFDLESEFKSNCVFLAIAWIKCVLFGSEQGKTVIQTGRIRSWNWVVT